MTGQPFTSADEALAYIRKHDADARVLDRHPRRFLEQVEREELAAHGQVRLVGELSADELVNSVLELRYPQIAQARRVYYDALIAADTTAEHALESRDMFRWNINQTGWAFKDRVVAGETITSFGEFQIQRSIIVPQAKIFLAPEPKEATMLNLLTYDGEVCRCNHTRSVHRHNTASTYCSTLWCACPRFRRPFRMPGRAWLGRLLRIAGEN